MKIFYYKIEKKNFGDDMNTWIWDELLPGFFNDNEDALMCGIGTIIRDDIPKAKKNIIFSSGVGFERLPEDISDKRWDIICVRGALTAEILGLDKSKVVTDGAILLSTLPEFKALPEKDRSGIVFIPHHRALDFGRWEEACRKAGIEFVSPREDAKAVIHKLRNAKLVIADAMHGAIVADTMRVPWIPVVVTSSINAFKWHDWATSMETEYKPYIMPSSSLKEKVTRLFLNTLGRVHVSGGTPDKAVKDYRRLISGNKNISYVKKKFWLATSKFFRFVAGKIIKTKIGKKWDDSCVERAAKALQNAARQRPFLSRDDVFSNRVTTMQEKLEELKNNYETVTDLKKSA